MNSTPSDDPKLNAAVGTGGASLLLREVSESDFPIFQDFCRLWKAGPAPNFDPSRSAENYLVWDGEDAVALFRGHHHFENWTISAEEQDRY